MNKLMNESVHIKRFKNSTPWNLRSVFLYLISMGLNFEKGKKTKMDDKGS